MDNVAAMSIETEEELEALRRAGRVVAVVLRELRRRVQPGLSTAALDALAGRVLARHGARSAPGAGDQRGGRGRGRQARRLPARGSRRPRDRPHDPRGAVRPNTPGDDPTLLHAGLVITIEPILGAGGRGIRLGGHGWTISTADGAPAAHVEHTIVATDGAPLVLTR